MKQLVRAIKVTRRAINLLLCMKSSILQLYYRYIMEWFWVHYYCLCLFLEF